MTIVMGLDQHRAQITAEWIDTETGEITRSRITPAHREGVRRFCEKFRGQQLEVGLEATTGWRLSPMSSRRSARSCISPSRLRPLRGEATKAAPRPIVLTRAISGS